jgi:hypothetical protein
MSKQTKFTKRTIAVAVSDSNLGRVEIPALVLGELAVHGALGGADGYTPTNYYYVVTHVPSGMIMAQGYKQRNCRQLVQKLHALDLDWNFPGPDLPDDVYQTAIPIVRAFNSNRNN